MHRSTFNHRKSGGYEPEESIQIGAPGALCAAVPERNRRKNRPPSFCRLRRQTAPVLYVRRGQRDGKRDYKLSTETGEVQRLSKGYWTITRMIASQCECCWMP